MTLARKRVLPWYKGGEERWKICRICSCYSMYTCKNDVFSISLPSRLYPLSHQCCYLSSLFPYCTKGYVCHLPVLAGTSDPKNPTSNYCCPIKQVANLARLSFSLLLKKHYKLKNWEVKQLEDLSLTFWFIHKLLVKMNFSLM